MSRDTARGHRDSPPRSAPPSAHRAFRRFRRTYASIAVWVLNTLALLLFVNAVLACVFAFREGSWRGVFPGERWELAWAHRDFAYDYAAYTKLSPQAAKDFVQVHRRMIAQGFDYRPWVQFTHHPFGSDRLNVDARGLRVTPGSEPSGKRELVGVFGGSTTFGTGVPDEDTIPSQLNGLLERTHPGGYYVRNYGVSYYYSSQELQELLVLLQQNESPKFAVFIDGLNDTAQTTKGVDAPWFTGVLTEAWDDVNGRRPSAIPMVRFAQALRRRLAGITLSHPALPDLDDDHRAAFAVDRYLKNQRSIRAICAEYGIAPLFVWQPVPFHKYDRRLMTTQLYPGGVPRFWSVVYDAMARVQAPDYLYLGDMLEDFHGKAFIDDVHYNEAISGRIADAIARRIGDSTR